MTYSIQNRRYIGNKYKLLSFIDGIFKKENVVFNSFADLFSGTGVVAEYFMTQGKQVIINDNLFSNFVFYQAWLSGGEYSSKKVEKYLNYYNGLDIAEDNYFSDNFSGTYFHREDARKIGFIREDIEKQKNNLTEREYYILLSSLLYTADKIANTVGHFEAFLGKKPEKQGVTLQNIEIKNYKFNPTIYQMDANKLIEKIQTDVLYLDPPYNARQYVNFYHLLENLAEWKKPKVYGKTLKMARKEKMSVYSQAKAKIALEELVQKAHTKYIALSYNNTYSAKSGASINKISEEDITRILSKIGSVKRFDVDYKFFNSGKTDFKNHKELLYLCTRFE